ncbi:hypothetical protein A3H53_03400 [Candidatus Nomurabacteria bacterium RIFCSPLOWO2_02_FULL_40_10]|uniref:Methyltransferase domain-containing protein n=2 Tax=Candidatus Nomuraibacteriota TaxID=1752729 RepID=A0A1F6XVK9_9BACT|nr:MAG: hypothetical protein A2642_01945 [Candidatus Nomurabacteria bacterium RIFCSPHIGHO2_01_FULL_39_10]OGI98170.1 MAG: hypothetical protein A3H53_03400 [Candidatus Nomurabacteria bacterium RIFCSPLOWO2_02_FULL_40_10]
MKKQTSLGVVADWYDELLEEDPDSFQAKVILPNLLRVLNLKPQKLEQGLPLLKIIDIACGQGYFSRALEVVGVKVMGTDISGELIAKAKERSPKIDFHVASADKLSFAFL